MAKDVNKVRIKLKAYEHEILDSSAATIVDALEREGASFSGPIPLPTKKEIVTILRSPHKYKDSREQFEQRTHRRIIDVYTPSAKMMEAALCQIADATSFKVRTACSFFPFRSRASASADAFA